MNVIRFDRDTDHVAAAHAAGYSGIVRYYADMYVYGGTDGHVRDALAAAVAEDAPTDVAFKALDTGRWVTWAEIDSNRAEIDARRGDAD